MLLKMIFRARVWLGIVTLVMLVACGSEPVVVPETTAEKASWSVNPYVLSLIGTTYDKAAKTASFELANTGTVAGQFELASEAKWLSLSPTSGTLEPAASTQITVQFTECISSQEFKTNIDISGSDAEQIVSVFLSCQGADQPDLAELSIPELKAEIFGSSTGVLSFSNRGKAALEYTLEGQADWLSLDASFGTVLPEETKQINLEANCTDKVGKFETELSLVTNDPTEAETPVLIQLDCADIALADISDLTPNRIEANTEVETSQTAKLSFTNQGQANLTFGLGELPDWLTVSPMTGSLEPAGLQALNLVMTCSNQEETLYWDLSLKTNDPAEAELSIPIVFDCTLAQSANTPDISSLTPNLIHLSAFTSKQTSASSAFSFRNLGTADLTYQIEKPVEATWLSLLSVQGTLSAGSSQKVDLSANCDSTATEKSTTLTLTSNDPDEAQKTLDITLSCTDLPKYTLNLSLIGPGAVISSPAGIDCGESCNAEFDLNSLITLSTSGISGSSFKAWKTGPCVGQGEVCTFILSKDTDMTAEFSTGKFDVTFRFSDSNLSQSQKKIFESAAARWAEVIVGDMPDQQATIQGKFCGDIPDFTGVIDDLMIDVIAPSIDGVNGVLGQAGPCYVRQNGVTYFGIMQLDKADINSLEASGQLENVILHEMGHILGIGTLWERVFDLLDYTGSSCAEASTIGYTGTHAKDAYKALGASGNVPVEDTGSLGTKCGHWREASFVNELMTGFLNSGQANPLSKLTIGSLEDMGYTVDYGAADSYALPTLRSQSQGKEIEEIIFMPVVFD